MRNETLLLILFICLQLTLSNADDTMFIRKHIKGEQIKTYFQIGEWLQQDYSEKGKCLEHFVLGCQKQSFKYDLDEAEVQYLQYQWSFLQKASEYKQKSQVKPLRMEYLKKLALLWDREAWYPGKFRHSTQLKDFWSCFKSILVTCNM